MRRLHDIVDQFKYMKRASEELNCQKRLFTNT